MHTMAFKIASLPWWSAALPALLAGAAAAADAPAVPVVTVGNAAAATAFEVDGSLQALRQATVAAQIGGNVVQLAVKAGDRVKAGQLLARIDERDTQAAMQRSDAAVAQADAEWRNARTAADRNRQLQAQGFVSQAALDMADTQLKAAQAGLAAAQAARSQAALARGFAAVTAPFDGVVQATHVEAGDLAAPGRALVTLYAPGALRAVVQLPTSRTAVARAATGAQVQLPDGNWIKPERRTELPAADPVSQTVEWRLDLPAQAIGVPGQAVRVRFEGAAAPATAAQRLTLPDAAVLRRGELTAVYVQQDQRFVLRAVRTGATAGGQVEVLAGLKAGERVAADALRAGLQAAK